MNLINGLHFRNLRGDIYGGITAGVVALPLALAMGVASGAGPIAGLYGAIFVGFFAALFGGTPAQVSGPTGPMTVVIAAIFTQYTAMFPDDPARGAEAAAMLFRVKAAVVYHAAGATGRGVFDAATRFGAKAIGVDSVVQDSSGNAGNSVAAYCARAGIDFEGFLADPATDVPEHDIPRTPSSSSSTRPVEPSMPWTSLPQIPHARTLTRASPGPREGTGASSRTSRPYSLSTRAFMVRGASAVMAQPRYQSRGSRTERPGPAEPGPAEPGPAEPGSAVDTGPAAAAGGPDGLGYSHSMVPGGLVVTS